MEFWFSELHSPHVKFDIRVEKQLFSGKSDYQRIDVFESPEFGKFLTLNGSVIFSEQDCFIYNEMVVHVPMAVHPDVKNVLIIGGGDGGVSKELLQYDNIENIDIVEQDSMFVDVCREYFPETSIGLDDERVHIYNYDALRFLRSKMNEYDLIINDATDPFGASEGLFTREFYGSCYKALKDDGILVYQHGSPFYDEDEDACRSMHKKVFHTFPISTERPVTVFQSAGYIRHTYLQARQVTGFSVLLQRSIIRLKILRQTSGKKETYIQNITQLIFIQEHLCFQSMLKNY